MSDLPDFSAHGYQIIRELGRNREGGRITWLAIEVKTDRQVVLKQFCFAQAGAAWSAFNAHEREIQVLQGLSHSGIPRYLGAIATEDGFCMIQEYIDAPSLAVHRSFEPDEIKEIAVKTLEILVYLQNRIPPIIHRDIKPDNILVDAQLNVYLIDFGFARIGSEEVSGSSVFKGTPGFIPPEQLRKPTEASDLYGLGATLICLLAGIKSTKIQELTSDDDPYLISFKALVPRLSLRFIEWLEKMVQPKLKDRYPNAETALEALKPLVTIVSNPPDSGSHHHQESRPRYQMIRELSRYQEGVCVIYLAKDNATQQPVILTRFVSNYPDYQRQIQLLRELHHPGIPPYIDYFQTSDGFCLVQEYFESQPLDAASNLSFEQIKDIAVSILEILVYLQSQNPPILHRNIKPETILVDAQMNVYLMDFSCAQIGGADMPLYRLVAKNPGFVSPELLRHRPASQASDLYSLGATLMCLLTQTESAKINTLISQDGGINVKGLVPTSLSLGLIDWLETMVAPNPKFRYPNAVTALDALKTIDVTRFADIQFQPETLDFIATKYGEILKKTVTVINPITDTVLSGTWDVAPHRAWISFAPAVVSGNKTVCQISVDTGKLMADKTYERQIVLHANTFQKPHSLPIKVQTAAIKPQKMLYVSLAVLLAISLAGGWLGALVVGITPDVTNWAVLAIGLAVGGVGGWAAAFSKIDLFVKTVGMILTLVTIVGFVALGADVDMVVGFFVGLAIAAVAGIVFKNHVEKKFSRIFAVWVSILTPALGMSLGIDSKLNFQNPLVMFTVLVTGVPLAIAIVNPYLQYLKILHNYRKSQRSLIKP